MPDCSIDVIENFGHSEQPLTVALDMVIGIVTINHGVASTRSWTRILRSADALKARFPQDGHLVKLIEVHEGTWGAGLGGRRLFYFATSSAANCG